MKAEINNENKAKFGALYLLTQTEFIAFDSMGINYHCQITFDTLRILWVDKESFMLLKPLSSISDEDAKRLGHVNANAFLNRREGKLLPYGIDYLRSKGYALPWMGLSVNEMVESKWIKLI